MKRYFLVDCNNFYVSCERVFNPKLHNKPVVVLGSNDACVIARSNEAKALDIAMGAPAFECKELFKKHNVIVYSANFALYGDMSNRVMQTLTHYATDIEIYSVDEAFLCAPHYAGPENQEQYFYYSYATMLRSHTHQYTGIPVSIGIGPTKTLAKVANKLAKKYKKLNGVFDITDHPALDTILASIAIEDVWGIGSRYAKKLRNHHITNAQEFKYTDEKWVRKNMTIVGLKTLYELRGISCFPLEESPQPKQSICVSRAFGKKINNILSAKEALASYVSCAAEKLRKQQTLTAHITIFALTNRYDDPHNYFRSAHCQLPIATDYTPQLITAANRCLEQIFKRTYQYKKVGVILSDLVPHDFRQMNITTPPLHNIIKQNKQMETIDRINTKWGRNTLFFAASGIEQPWKMHQAHKSACFTTNWHELLTITI